jgi:hypothetical protein
MPAASESEHVQGHRNASGANLEGHFHHRTTKTMFTGTYLEALASAALIVVIIAGVFGLCYWVVNFFVNRRGR